MKTIRELLLSTSFDAAFPFNFEGVKAVVAEQGRPMMIQIEGKGIFWIVPNKDKRGDEMFGEDEIKLGEDDLLLPEMPPITDYNLLREIYSCVENAVERFKSFSDRSSLLRASNAGDEESVLKLFEKANLNQSEINNVFLNAARDQKKDLVLFLLEKNADINAQRETVKRCALHEAVNNKSAEMVEFLLDRGASPNVCDFNKDSPLHLAIRILRESEIGIRIYEILCDHGAKVDLENDYKETPLSLSQNMPKIKEVLEKARERHHAEGVHVDLVHSTVEVVLDGAPIIDLPTTSPAAASSAQLKKRASQAARGQN